MAEVGADATRAARAVEGGGRPLPRAVRAYFEPRYGVSLEGVRVHDGGVAAAAARGIGAEAYAFGRGIAFAPGRFAPGAPSGLRLIGHELAHVAQAGGAPARAADARLGAEADPAERDAGLMAAAALSGRSARPGLSERAGTLRRFSAPQHVPERTYVAGQDPENDGFLSDAIAYHRQWGLNPQAVDSLEDVIDDLKGDAGLIGRVRIVTHASQQNLYTALFEGGSPGIREHVLRGFAAGGEEGVGATLYGGGRAGLMSEATYGRVLTQVRRADPDALLPFGLERRRARLTGPVGDFFRRAVDLLFHRAGAVSADEGRVRDAVEREMNALRPQVEATRTPDGEPPTTAQIDALRDAVLDIRVVDVQRDPRLAQDVGAAETAITAGFYADLAAVRRRFTAASWIDIRGCRVGANRSYLEAVAAFFGRPGALPHVSGPDWFQSFPSLGYRVVREREIPALARNRGVRRALDHWFEETGAVSRLRWAHTLYLRLLTSVLRGEAEALRTSTPPALFGGLRAPVDLTAALPPLGVGEDLAVGALGDLRLSIDAPAIRAPDLAPPSLGVSLRPGVEAEERRLRGEIEALTRMPPARKLRYYFEQSLALPVLELGGAANDRRLLVLEGREEASLDAWLNSQWGADLPGLAQLRAMEIADTETRRVAALQRERARIRPGGFAVAPDSRYRAHIKDV